MIISNVNIGSGPGLNDGESIYSAFYKVNQNFANVQSNVNSLTNSVSSVAGRTGNVTLTINDIVGLNSSYAVNGNVTAANVGMKGYVDAKIAANIAALIDSAPGVLDTLNELAAAINDDASFATTIVNTINSTNSNVTIANTNMKGYVDGQVSAVNSAIILANTIQSNQISSANLGMKGYVDSLTYSNVQVATYLPTYTGNIKAQYANLIGAADTGLNSIRGGLPGIEVFGNTIAQFHTNINSPAHVAVHNKSTGPEATSGFMATADIGDENNFRTLVGIFGSGYTPLSWAKPLDSVLLGMGGNLVIGTNNNANIANPIKDINFVIANGSVLIPLKISAEPGMAQANVELGTNTGLKFSDGTRQTSAYSNVQTATYTNLSTYAYNANVTAANIGMKGYVDSVASQSIFGNGNVLSYLTQFDGNIVPSANVTYSLGNITNRWKDLYLSGNTIFLGDATITTEGGRLITTGAAISPPTGAVAFANVQFEAPTNFDQIRSYYVDNNFGYTANLKSWTTAPIVWDELRSAKIKINSTIVSGSTPDFASLDTSGGRFANAVATLDATGNIASLTITDGGVGYDSYYPYYAVDSAGYNNNYIGQSYTGSPTGKSFRRIGLIPTTGADIGNITSIGSFTRYSDLPTVGTNSYTWTGNTGTTINFTVDWSSNTVTAYTYTPALPALTSAQDWQDWILDYQSTNDYGWIIGSGSITGGGGTPIQAVYDYLSREALPTSLTYDQSATTWYPGNLLVNNSSSVASLSSQTFFVTFNRTSINYATLENSYGNPIYWSRGLSADTGISSGGDMTVAGDLRVAGDLYVSPTSIYMGNLRISAADGNLKVNTAIKFGDDSVQSSAYSNVQVAAYLTANPPAGTYSNVQVAAYLPTYSGNINANVAGFSIGYRDVPQVSAGNVTLALTDAGKHYYSSASAPTTLTIPSNANVAFTVGTAITIVNAGVGNVSISKQVEVGLYLAGNATSATRTLTSYGMATLLKTATDQWFVNGTGLV